MTLPENGHSKIQKAEWRESLVFVENNNCPEMGTTEEGTRRKVEK